MGTDAKLQLILQARDDASAVLKELNRALSGTAQEAKGASGGVSSFGDTLKALISADVLKGLFEKITGFLGSFSEAAGQGQLATLNLSRALQGIGVNYSDVSGSIDTLITSQVKLAGVSEEDTKNAISTLVDITKSYNDSLKLLPLTIDIARAKQMSLAEAADLVGRAATGNDTRLQRMLGLMSDATTATETLAEAQRRYGGYAEEYANTQIGSQERWANVLDRIKDTLGTAFLPLTTSLTTALSAAGEAMQPELQTISENIRTWALNAAADFFYWGANMVQQLAAGISGSSAVVDALNSIGQYFTDMLQAHSPPRLLPDLTKWGAAAMQSYLAGWGQATSGASDILNNWGDAIAPYLKSIDLGNLFNPAMGRDIKAKFGDQGQLMTDYVSTYSDLQRATENVTKTQKDYDEAVKGGDKDKIQSAKGKLDSAKLAESQAKAAFEAAQNRVREAAEAQARLTTAIKQQTQAIQAQSKANDDAAARKAEADAKALAAAKLAYEMSKTDTAGKIALLDAEAAKHAEGSLEWYQIETQKQGLLKQLQSEQDAAAKAGAAATKNQAANLDVLQDKTDKYQMPDFLDPAVMKLKKADTLWDLIKNLGESLSSKFITQFLDICGARLLTWVTGIGKDPAIISAFTTAGAAFGDAIWEAIRVKLNEKWNNMWAKIYEFKFQLPQLGGGLIPLTPFASGFNGIVTSPKAMLVGEAGPERVQVTPLGSDTPAGSTIINHNWYIKSTDPKKAADEIKIMMHAEGIA